MIIPPREPSGSSKLSKWLKQLLMFAKSCEVKPGLGYRVRKTNAGTILEIDINPASMPAGGAIYAAQVQSHTPGNDYSSVKLATYDAGTDTWTASGSAFNAALPVLLRQAAKPTSSHSTAVAVVWPKYEEDDLVFLFQPEGGTGIEVSSSELEYCILPDGRAWCFEFPICLNNGNVLYSIIPAWSLSSSSNGEFEPVE